MQTKIQRRYFLSFLMQAFNAMNIFFHPSFLSFLLLVSTLFLGAVSIRATVMWRWIPSCFVFLEVSVPFMISLSFSCKPVSLIVLVRRNVINSDYLPEENASPFLSIIKFLLLYPSWPPPKDSFAWCGAVLHSFIILFI